MKVELPSGEKQKQELEGSERIRALKATPCLLSQLGSHEQFNPRPPLLL